MKRTLFAVAAIMIVALLAVKSNAETPSTSNTQAPDWRCVWHGGQWWYWTPQNSWLVWSGSTWVPYEQPYRSATATMSQPMPYSTGYGSYEAQYPGTTPQPTYSGNAYQPGYSSGYSSGSGESYAGYGWTWGPGTAFSNAPGRRF